ncbi:DNA mismatch repair protein MutL [candidate division KSB3 bacterium]|uniref:DNA mismatch repair protein MutL n=1 Tax=candidate division KSB3 bacterium TaxID=2044937 RepID=A0A2G6E4B3_9BACT|nr:MAG: DNA mismatch repair protein MutL [candidate division KSB3 bacterium]PIE29372.1 MAG: DNA mismatch repair protein MutL [candidate division KSB3 bacterium]
MNPNIHVLPDEVANHIAAGEVIERPASAVKELIENSIDAGATQIDVEIGIGGKAYIRIKDNGHGMSRDNARLAFERHATSKISSTRDISAISTLGFRGEALPSIASVSKLKLLTRSSDEIAGTRIEIHGGHCINIVDAGSSPGTYIEVNDLFYKTPARLKFLKSPGTEMGYINGIISDQALAHPEIGFSVKNNGKEQLSLPAGSSLEQRVAGLFGRDIVRELVEIRDVAGSLEIRGLIGLPSCNRASRTYQKTIVNGRPIKDKTIIHAIQQAYDTLVPKRRHAVVFLFITLPLQLVDVNVHPGKTEIRFVHSQSIHELVVKSIRKTLNAALNTRSLPSFGTAPAPGDNPVFTPQNAASDDSPANFSPGRPESSQKRLPLTARTNFQLSPPGDGSSNAVTAAFRQEDTEHSPTCCNVQHRPAAGPSPASEQHLPHPVTDGYALFGRLRPIGQFDDTYILAQTNEDLYIIDQHAAHERVYYEKYKAQFQTQDFEVQQLLFPVSLELSHREQAILEEHLDSLHEHGFDLEPFGGTTYLLKAVPALLAKSDYKKLLYDIIDRYEAHKSSTIEQKIDQVLKVMACHTAIRAHQRLQDSQIIALLKQMDELALPYTCPHGRPTAIKISLGDLEKKFGRIV